jgi:hypothetical protein
LQKAAFLFLQSLGGLKSVDQNAEITKTKLINENNTNE